jgi:hypothetical protein
MAGFTGKAIVGDMHAFRATDPREKDIAEGHNPIQVRLPVPRLVRGQYFA